MNKPAAIAAQLVDVRNVNTHKCVRMTIDVPAEQAMLVVEAFGWPTQVNPVPVAIARLDLSNAKLGGEPARDRPPVEAAGLCGETLDRPHKPRKPVAAEKRLANEAGRMCADPVFQTYLREATGRAHGEPEAATFVRACCHVGSRAEIVPGSEAAERWINLRGLFEAWKLADVA